MINMTFTTYVKMINALAQRLIKADTIYITVTSEEKERPVDRDYLCCVSAIRIRGIEITFRKCLTVCINGIQPDSVIFNFCKSNGSVKIMKF